MRYRGTRLHRGKRAGRHRDHLMRDLGGAIGLASIGTIMNTRLHFHWNRLIEDINPARPVVQQFLDTHANRFESLIPVIRVRPL